MNVEMLVKCLKLAGRYQVYSDGAGNYSILPIHPLAIEITPEADEQMRANCDSLNYNKKRD